MSGPQKGKGMMEREGDEKRRGGKDSEEKGG